MVEGRVLEWTPQKGFGIIQGDDGAQVFVHHTQISTAGFKNLFDGQRVRYDVKSEPRGSQAINVVPLPLYEVDLSPEEWSLIRHRCDEKKVQAASRDSVDPWNRPQVVVTVDATHKDALADWVSEIQGAMKAQQPGNPVFIVDFEYDEGAGSGWCAAGADSAEAAEALVTAKLKELLPEGVVDGDVVESQPLADYEDEQGRTLSLSCYPKPGEVRPLG